MDDILAGEIELPEKLKLSEGDKARTVTVTWMEDDRGFTGDLIFVYEFHNDKYLYCYSVYYRIRQHSHDSGNKANIYFNIQADGIGKLFEADSPDAMHQTGEWLIFYEGKQYMNVGANKSVTAYVKFTFDRGGNWDPSAEGFITLD